MAVLAAVLVPAAAGLPASGVRFLWHHVLLWTTRAESASAVEITRGSSTNGAKKGAAPKLMSTVASSASAKMMSAVAPLWLAILRRTPTYPMSGATDHTTTARNGSGQTGCL
jgi:hypothetical protein